jgi:hypothetical protein
LSPVVLDPYLLDDASRSREALLVLLRARAVLRRHGWCQGVQMDERGRFSLGGALGEGGLASVYDMAAIEWARRAVRKHIGGVNIPGWNDVPHRILHEVLHVLDRAIQDCGGEEPRDGGWSVSMGPPRGAPLPVRLPSKHRRSAQ